MVRDGPAADDPSMDAPPIEPPMDPTAPGSPDPGPPPAASAPPRRLARRSDERLLGGVAGGVAEYLGVDVVLVRLGFVVTAFFGGLGVDRLPARVDRAARRSVGDGVTAVG